MADDYKEQAQYFANVPLMQSGVVASVHLEDSDDKNFWNSMLQSRKPGRYYFITQSRSPKGFDTKGCEQCLKYRPYLSKQFFICIDSDMRYLYKPLLLLLYCLKNDKPDFNLRMFSACLPNQCKRAELADNGKLLIEKIAKNFDPYLNTDFAKSIDFKAESNYCKTLNVNEQNAYLHVRGHNIFDLVAYIGDLLCRGTSVSFKKDVLMKDLPPQVYWQIKKVAADIAAIV